MQFQCTKFNFYNLVYNFIVLKKLLIKLCSVGFSLLSYSFIVSLCVKLFVLSFQAYRIWFCGYFIKYKSRCLILQTILIHIPLNDMIKSHMKKTNSFDSRFRYHKLLIMTWNISLQIILNLILYLDLIK